MKSKVKAIIDRAEQQCKANGTRMTSKRKQILYGLLQSDKALSAYELVEYCKTEFNETIPAMSVYRILEFLEEERLVHRLNLANKYVACAHIAGEHEHSVSQFLICQSCQRVKEVDISESVVRSLKQNVRDAGFELHRPQLEINCICAGCANSHA
ncbi:MAG: Fur family transcriptional regulator [Gammaproteobacteria bacterium]|nr:Fur family transcriptional regulator [Gammaproteobacteria bacterium]